MNSNSKVKRVKSFRRQNKFVVELHPTRPKNLSRSVQVILVWLDRNEEKMDRLDRHLKEIRRPAANRTKISRVRLEKVLSVDTTFTVKELDQSRIFQSKNSSFCCLTALTSLRNKLKIIWRNERPVMLWGFCTWKKNIIWYELEIWRDYWRYQQHHTYSSRLYYSLELMTEYVTDRLYYDY